MSVWPLLVAGALLGALGDAALRTEAPPALNFSLWIAAVAAAAFVLNRRAAPALDRGRAVLLLLGVLFAAGLAWRDSPPLKLLALGSSTLIFALAAFRLDAVWVRRAGVVRYGAAVALGALHAWTASVLVFLDRGRSAPGAADGPSSWRRAGGVARGLALAAPPLALFGALFMAADPVFAKLVANALHFDIEWIAGHVALFSIAAWLSTGYLRGFLAGTELPWLANVQQGRGNDAVPMPRWLALGVTEVTTALSAIDLLFLAFVIVQFRYLFGGAALVQITPDLTYAEYARHGFFELVFAVALVVPLLLAADWLLERRLRRDELLFRGLAGAQVALVLAIAASALQRLRLYHASYGLTEARFYAMVLLLWMGATLVWLAATVLRGRRRSFAFGALVSGLATVALLFVVNPDAIIARTNVARLSQSSGAPASFDVVYATSLSADAVPVLVDALPALPGDVQCRLAQHMLRQWPSGSERSFLSWNWSAARAAGAVRERGTWLQSMLGPGLRCAPPD